MIDSANFHLNIPINAYTSSLNPQIHFNQCTVCMYISLKHQKGIHCRGKPAHD